jgi:hypothetical protein
MILRLFPHGNSTAPTPELVFLYAIVDQALVASHSLWHHTGLISIAAAVGTSGWRMYSPQMITQSMPVPGRRI